MLDGVVRLKLDGTWRDLRPADGPVVVGRGVRHELCNTSGRQAHLRTEVMPAGGLEEFLTEAARAGREGLYDRRGLPRSVRGAGWIAVESQRVGTIDAVAQLARYLERSRGAPSLELCRGILAAQVIKPQARTLAEARGIDCVVVDLAVLRGERQPDLTLFAA